jgi:hypothetical protein
MFREFLGPQRTFLAVGVGSYQPITLKSTHV